MANVYVTSQGDVWDTIAKKQLGSELYMDALIGANWDQRKITEFPSGVTLTLPEITQERTETQASETAPWR